MYVRMCVRARARNATNIDRFIIRFRLLFALNVGVFASAEMMRAYEREEK